MNFTDLLKSLHQEYLHSLPDKISMIEKQIKSGQTEQIADCFHKLKGTGTTYGFPEVSELGLVVEEICLTRPLQALTAAQLAVELLRDVYNARQRQTAFDLATDPRIVSMRKMLQN
jgi:HPt (histidine-containing phosphotransfer) domain-containing protein